MPTFKKGSKQAKDYMAYIRSLKKTSKPKKVGAIKIVEKGENKFTKPSAIFEYTRTKKGTFKGMKKIGVAKPSTHKDTKSHNVNIRVLSGSKKRIGNVPKPYDVHAVNEIKLFIENDYQLYKSQLLPILVNLTKKYKKGTFDITKAAKLFRYLIDSGLKKYHKDYGSKGDKWFELLSTNDRQYLAEWFANDTLIELNAGNEWN